jgi:hypothetical protein
MAVSQTLCPAGSAFAANASASASTVYVTSLQPVNSWYVVNTGSNPVLVRFGANLSSPVTAVFPVVGTPALGTVIAANASQVFTMPSNLQTSTNNSSGLPLGFTSNVQLSLIAGTGTNTVYITPVVTE